MVHKYLYEKKDGRILARGRNIPLTPGPGLGIVADERLIPSSALAFWRVSGNGKELIRLPDDVVARQRSETAARIQSADMLYQLESETFWNILEEGDLKEALILLGERIFPRKGEHQ